MTEPEAARAGAGDGRECAPASAGQRQLWLLHQLQPGSRRYHMALVLRLTGRLHADALQRALDQVVSRHEVLRTTLVAIDGEPVQRIAPRASFPLTVSDIRDIPAPERPTVAEGLARETLAQAFDLERGPLARGRLIVLDETEDHLVLSLHHAVFDGASFAVMFRDLAAYYAGDVSGRGSEPPPLPLQYRDFAASQQAALAGTEMDAQLEYWRRQLAGLTELSLPHDRRGDDSDLSGGRHALLLPAPLSRELRRLARVTGTTPFMVLTAGLAVLLSRHVDRPDIAVGIPVEGRGRTELEDLVGFFVNTVVLRLDLSSTPSFLDLLAQVRERALDAYAHQDVPFERLVQELRPARSADRSPLVDVFVNFLNAPDARLALPGIDAEELPLPDAEVKFGLTLYAEDTGGRIGLDFVYRRAHYTPNLIAAVADQLEYLLAQLAVAPDDLLTRHSLVTPRAAVLLPDPCVPLDASRHERVTETFLRQAAGRPDAIAIAGGATATSYGELASLASGIGEQLAAAHLPAGAVAAVTGRRGPALIAAILAVLASRGVLLALDATLPPERRRVMLAESRASIIVAVECDEDEEQELLAHGLPLLCIRQRGPAISLAERRSGRGAPGEPNGAPAEPLPAAARVGDDAAYVFFTSGSSGIPKAILGSHNGLARFVAWQRGTFAIGPRDRSAQLTGLSFDVVLRDILTPLTSGATLVLPDETEDAASGGVLAWLVREGVTLLHTVPSLAAAWLAAADPAATLAALRWVFFAGEPLTAGLVRRWRRACPSAAVANFYGPTETTLATCSFVVPNPAEQEVQPIGRPLPGSQVLVLAPGDRLCGVGEPGELVVRTPYGSHGYVNATADQAARFQPNPYASNARDVVYRTGDRGRYRADGSLDILGRMDDETKIHGIRVSPAEVAAAVSSHPGVRHAVVFADRDDRGDPFLAAYIVPLDRARFSLADLRRHLAARLPTALVPSRFAVLDALPLTANGKVDRAALPPAVPDAGAAGYRAPETDVEREIAGLWSDLLQRDRVGTDEDFFALGGHSLLAAQLLARIRSRLHVQLPLRTLFDRPTVRGLASAVEQAKAAGAAPAGVTIARADRAALRVRRRPGDGNTH